MYIWLWKRINIQMFKCSIQICYLSTKFIKKKCLYSSIIVRTHPLPFKKGVGSKFWSMVQGQVFLKWGGRGGQHFLFIFFKSLSFLHLEINLPLQNCVMHLKKKYFVTIILWKNIILSFLKWTWKCSIKITYLQRNLKD